MPVLAWTIDGPLMIKTRNIPEIVIAETLQRWTRAIIIGENEANARDEREARVSCHPFPGSWDKDKEQLNSSEPTHDSARETMD
jgi:hypothetical protein